jgi:Domain of Unknown Function (DUF748)
LNRGRLLKLALIASLGVVIVGGAVWWALPAMIRRVAISQISARTGRAVTIEHVLLNPFTGRLSVRALRLAERGGTDTFLDLPQLEMRFVPGALLRSDIRLAEVALVAPTVRVVRTTSREFNFSDLLPPPAASEASPRRWTLTVDRLTISNGAVHAHDEAVTPATDWQVRELGLELGQLTTRPGANPGSGSARARIDEAKLELTSEALRLEPLGAIVQIALDGFELRRLSPYMSHAGAPYRMKGGRLAAALTANVDQKGEELTRAALSGTVSVEGEAVARTEHEDTFLEIPRAEVNVKEADAIARSLSISSVAIEGAKLRARRDRQGVIDLVDILRNTTPAAMDPSAAAPAPPPTVSRRLIAAVGALAHGFTQIQVDRVVLGPSAVTVVDESVKPPTTLALTGMHTTMTDFTWPPRRPAALALSAILPGGGTLDAKGSVVIQPFDAQLATVVRDARIHPYQAYVPGVAQLRGRVSGNSRSHIALKDDGTMLLASKGTSWAQGVEVWAPGATSPAIRVQRMDLVGIDLDWPRRARVAKVAFRRPEVEIVREGDGSFDVAKLLRVPAPRAEDGETNAVAVPAASPRSERPKGALETMKLDFDEVRVDDGFVRFLDRTMSPAFSKDLSRLSLVVNNLGNRPGQRARLKATSIVAGDSAVDLRGELGAIGSPASADLVGDLHDMQLASINPYAEHAIGWVVKKGDLNYKLHFTLDANALEATNEIVVGQLQVAPASGADWVRQQIGMPLNLIVALAKDARGEIRVNVPLSGSIDNPSFDLRRVVWTTVKKAVARLVRNPFRAISRALRGTDTDTVEVPAVDPVTFAPGSAVISPEMEQYLLRVADVLRRSPFVNLALASAPSREDVEALKAQTLRDKLRAFQAERRLPDGPGVVAAYFAERFPTIEPPTTTEKQLALLREREPAPEGRLDDLSRRRVEATRERLISVEGIPAGRLAIGAASPAAPSLADGEGRVELTLVAGGE